MATECEKLKTLLRASLAAAKEASPTKVRKAQEGLRAFIAVAQDKELRDIAVRAIIALGVATVIDVTEQIVALEAERAAECAG